MALLRAEVRNRLGAVSIYDCIIETIQDLSTEPMLEKVHAGSIVLCLNLDLTSEAGGEAQSAPGCYIKATDGSWKPCAVSDAHLMNFMESMMAQKVLGITGGSTSGGGSGGGSRVTYGEFTNASDTYAPAPIDVQADWDHFVIWTEAPFLVGQANINGAVIWKKPNSILAYKVMYTNSAGTYGAISYLPDGGTLFRLDDSNRNVLCFTADQVFGVYLANTTYHWAAWKEDV